MASVKDEFNNALTRAAEQYGVSVETARAIFKKLLIKRTLQIIGLILCGIVIAKLAIK